MAEYIEREYLLDLYKGFDTPEYEKLSVPCPVVYQNVLDVPAADVVPVRHGRWIQHYVGQERTPWGSDCSVCGEWLVIDRLVMQEKYHYCPNCCAKMEES